MIEPAPSTNAAPPCALSEEDKQRIAAIREKIPASVTVIDIPAQAKFDDAIQALDQFVKSTYEPGRIVNPMPSIEQGYESAIRAALRHAYAPVPLPPREKTLQPRSFTLRFAKKPPVNGHAPDTATLEWNEKHKAALDDAAQDARIIVGIYRKLWNPEVVAQIKQSSGAAHGRAV